MEKRVVKVRQVKEYREAKSHVLIGEMLEENERYLRLRCKSFHFRTGSYKTTGNVDVGKIKARWIPWSMIAVVTELPADFDWVTAEFKIDKDGKLILQGEYSHEALEEVGDS
jgi:hypothetical protein